MKTSKMKANNRRPFFGRRQAKRSILVKGEWKAVELDPGLFAEEGMEGMVCFEELTDYRLMDADTATAIAARREKKKRKASEREEAEVVDEEGEETTGPAKKKAKKKKRRAATEPDRSTEATQTKEDASKAEASTSKHEVQSKTKKKQKHQLEGGKVTEPQHQSRQTTNMKQTKNWTNTALCASGDRDADVSAWKDLFVPPPVLQALSCLGFGSPTPIQALALPPAIRDHMDILGAAETGEFYVS